MKYVKLFVGFLAAGIACILGSFYIRTLNVGVVWCPINARLPSDIALWLTPCYIGQTAVLLFRVGVALLLVALVIGLYGYFSDRKNVKLAKIESSSQLSLIVFRKNTDEAK